MTAKVLGPHLRPGGRAARAVFDIVKAGAGGQGDRASALWLAWSRNSGRMLEDSYYRANLSDVREQEEDTLVEGTVMVLISEELTSAAASKSSERLVGT